MKVCISLNVAASYRSTVLKELEKKIDCDFYFGNRVRYPLNLMVYSDLNGYRGLLEFKDLILGLYWQKGLLRLLSKDYNQYIITGEPHAISTWAFLVISKIFRKEVFLWSHGLYGRESLVKRVVKKRFFSLADGVLLYGKRSVELMERQGYSRDKLHCIYNSLNYPLHESIRLSKMDVLSEALYSKSKQLIFVGRITEAKRLDILIHAVGLSIKNGLNVKLLIIGNGNKRPLESLVKAHDLVDKVEFREGTFNELELGSLFLKSWLCVSPGNVGLLAMHSLAYGTPVITHGDFNSQMPEVESIIPGKTGDFFEKGSILALSKKIEQWCTYSKEDMRLIRKDCYESISRTYTPANQVKQIISALNLKTK